MTPTQIVTRGLGSYRSLGTLLSQSKTRNVLLVTGQRSFVTSGAQAILSELNAKFRVTHFNQFEVNPKFEDALKALEIAKNALPDTVVAVGGGSVMDMAKLVLAFFEADKEGCAKIARGTETPRNPGLNFVAVPTTAGSGSESTCFAVVYCQGVKYSVAAPFLLPSAVILDAELIRSGSARQKASNGLDALAQGIESYWAVKANARSREYARQAIPVLWDRLRSFVDDSLSAAESQTILEATHRAGQAINISKTTAAHAFSYAFTDKYGVPHGEAVWLTLPAIFQLHYRASKTREFEVTNRHNLREAMEDLVNMMGLDTERLAEQLSTFVTSLGLRQSMAEVGASSANKKRYLMEQVNAERMTNNPVLLPVDTVMKKIFGIIGSTHNPVKPPINS